MAGRVCLVGAGPGDPGLLTVRARDLLARADVVIHDALVSEAVLACASPGAQVIYAGKRAARHALSQDEVNRRMVEHARAGRLVVRLKGGDPFTFGRGGEEALALAGAGIPFEVVPGVTSGIAAAACAGIPVTHRDLASCVTLVTGHEAAEKAESSLDWDALARTGGTLVFYMGVSRLGPICCRLMEAGLAPDTPAAAVCRGTTPRQRTVSATLATLSDAAEREGVESPAVIVVGAVVSLRERLAWFEARPLFGLRVVVTRPRAQAAELTGRLLELGAEVVEFPAIRIEPPEDPAPLQEAAARAGACDWVVFASVNGVEAFFEALRRQGLDARALSGCRVAAIGPATSERLLRNGVAADLMPERHTTAELAKALAAEDLSGKRVLCPRADIAPPQMAEALRRAGARVEEVVAYRTVADAGRGEGLAAAMRAGQVDWVTFTSASCVRHVVEAIGADALSAGPARVASMGPATSEALRAAGLDVDAEATEQTVRGLVEALLRATGSYGRQD